MSTKAQQIYERVETLVRDKGVQKAEAFRTLAAEFGQPVDSVRGAYYTGRKQTLGDSAPSTRRSRRKARDTSPEGAINAAVMALEDTIAAIEQEVSDAQTRAEEAQAEHAELAASAEARIAEIRVKVEALTGSKANRGKPANEVTSQ